MAPYPRPMDSISSGAKMPARRSRHRVKNRDKSVCVSAKQPVTENGRYELINCVGSRGLSFIEIQPHGLASPNSAFIIFTSPRSFFHPFPLFFFPCPLFPPSLPPLRVTKKRLDFVLTDLENERHGNAYTADRMEYARTSNDN